MFIEVMSRSHNETISIFFSGVKIILMQVMYTVVFIEENLVEHGNKVTEVC